MTLYEWLKTRYERLKARHERLKTLCGRLKARHERRKTLYQSLNARCELPKTRCFLARPTRAVLEAGALFTNLPSALRRSEDEWGAAGDDLEFKSAEKAEEAAPAAEDEESWDTPTLPLPAPAAAPSAAFSTPMIIVNLSKLTHHKIHNKNDRNSNNDPALVSQHKKDIEADYAAFAASAEHLANAVVIPCGERVFAAALQQLRDDNPGHYFLPVFPPK